MSRCVMGVWKDRLGVRAVISSIYISVCPYWYIRYLPVHTLYSQVSVCPEVVVSSSIVVSSAIVVSSQ